MPDCSNVEIRELLPEQAAGSLEGERARRVVDHLDGCVDCAAELTVVRSARAVLLRAPAVDLSRIAAGVTEATRARSSAGAMAPRRQVGLRAAAALLLVATGASAVAVWRGRSDAPAPLPAAAVPRATPAGNGLALNGGFADLSDSEIEALMDHIEDLDAAHAQEPDATLPALAIGELGGA